MHVILSALDQSRAAFVSMCFTFIIFVIPVNVNAQRELNLNLNLLGNHRSLLSPTVDVLSDLPRKLMVQSEGGSIKYIPNDPDLREAQRFMQEGFRLLEEINSKKVQSLVVGKDRSTMMR